VESIHLVHAVSVRDGAVVSEAGDRAFLTSLRSSAKPFKALPLVRSRDDLDDEDIAIASASHRAEPEQLEAVRRLLAKAPATEDEPRGRAPGGPSARNRSSTTAPASTPAMLRDVPGSRLADGGVPARRPSASRTRSWRGSQPPLSSSPVSSKTAVDGCGVVCFALPLEQVAFMFSWLENREGGGRVAAAMRAHPQLVGGAGQPEHRVDAGLARLTAKIGRGRALLRRRPPRDSALP